MSIFPQHKNSLEYLFVTISLAFLYELVMILNVRTTVSYSLFYNYRSICYVVPLRRAEMALTPNVTYNEVRRARKSDTGPSE